MNIRNFICAAVLLVSPAVVPAQAPAWQSRALSWSVGAGGGGAVFDCGPCSMDADQGVAGFARGMVALRSRLAIGAELGGWVGRYEASPGTGVASVTSASVVAQWYPLSRYAGFVKAGAGLGWIREELTLNQMGRTTVKANGAIFGAGAGWDIPVRGRWWATPYLDFTVHPSSPQTVNGAKTNNELGATLLRAGLALTIR
jgi:hypothetical protein